MNERLVDESLRRELRALFDKQFAGAEARLDQIFVRCNAQAEVPNPALEAAVRRKETIKVWVLLVWGSVLVGLIGLYFKP